MRNILEPGSATAKAAVWLLLVLGAISPFAVIFLLNPKPCDAYFDRKGCLEFNREKTLYESVKLDAEISYVSSRSEDLRWLKENGAKLELVALPPASVALEQTPAITIFVHGFRGVDGVVATYFQEMTSQLIRDSRYSGMVVVYDWPSKARDYFALSQFERGYNAKLLDGIIPWHPITWQISRVTR